MRNSLKYFSILIILLTNVSCKTNNKSTAKEEINGDTVITQDVVDPMKPVKSDSTKIKSDSSLSRLVIQFYSIGEGIDRNANSAFEDSIKTYSQRIGKNIDYRKTHWGREGEIDYCLDLNELTSAEQMDFVEEISGNLKKAKWVHVYENYPCPERGRSR